MKKITDNIITDKAQREELMNRIDVLEKVKRLITMPGTQVMTTRQVSDFYGIDHNTLRRVWQRHRDEINGNGVAFIKPDFKNSRINVIATPEVEVPENWEQFGVRQTVALQMVRSGVYKIDNSDFTISAYGTYIYTLRAVLNIGMLLEGSDVAREVRNQLLNTWENAPQDVRIKEIDDELEIQRELGAAIMSQQIPRIAQAVGAAMGFKNRHIARLESELDQRAAELSSVSQELNVANERIADDKELIDKITADNDALYANIRTLPPRRLVVSMMRSFAQHLHSPNPYALAYNCLYKALRDQWGIELRGRKTEGNLLDTVTDDEWPKLIKTAATLCTEKHMNLHAIFGDANIDQIAAAEDTIESEETA